MSDKWSMSEERVFLENLVAERFNMFLIFTGIIVAGAGSTKIKALQIATLSLGLTVCILLWISIIGVQRKATIVRNILSGDKRHPIAVVMSRGNKFEYAKLLSHLIPVIVIAFLSYLLISSTFINQTTTSVGTVSTNSSNETR